MAQHGASDRRGGFGALDWLVIAIVNIMWGLNNIAAKLSMADLSPMGVAFIRQCMVALVCLPFLRIVPGRMGAVLALATISGALFFIPQNLSIALATNIGAISIAGQLSAPFAVILSIIFLGESVHLPRIIGLVMAFSGVVLIGFDPAIVDEVPALLLIVLAALTVAVGSLLVRRLTGVFVGTLYAWMGVVGVAALGPLFMMTTQDALGEIGRMAPATWGWIAFSAVGSSLLGHGGVAWLVQRHDIGAVMPYTLIAPVLSVIVASMTFGTPITGIMILGGIIVLAGVAIVTVRTAARGELVEEYS